MSIYSNPIYKAWAENCKDRIEFLAYLKDLYGPIGLVQVIVTLMKGGKCEDNRNKTTAEGRDLIKQAEGLHLTAYLCPGKRWTIGYGHTGKDVYEGMVITQDQAEGLLDQDIQRFECDVRSLVKVPITDNQFSALVSFAFNVGSDIDDDTIAEGLGDSTLLKKLNAGDRIGAANEFEKWVYGGGKKLNGLVKRRKAEKELFLKETP